MKLSQSIEIDRSTNGDYLVQWNNHFTSEPVDIYISLSPDQFDLDSPVIQKATSKALTPQLKENTRHYFYLKPEKGHAAVIAERKLPLQAGINFRDMGGYKTTDGQYVKWGRLFRSGHMTSLTKTDKAFLAGLDLTAVCDFRREEERKKSPTQLHGPVAIAEMPISPGSRTGFAEKLAQTNADQDSMTEFMKEINRDLVLSHADTYRKMIELLLSLKGGQLVINCSAGKDRTGLGAAIILATLGVPKETIKYDYLLSQKYFPIEQEMARMLTLFNQQHHITAEQLRPVLEAREDYIQSAFNSIESEYNSMENYLAEHLGINAEKQAELRHNYTHTY